MGLSCHCDCVIPHVDPHNFLCLVDLAVFLSHEGNLFHSGIIFEMIKYIMKKVS